MAQASRWLWGLAPVALLWAIANLSLGAAVQQDVGRRAVAAVTAAAGEAPGARPIQARVVGRDVLIAGEALSADGAAKAIAGLRAEFGIRRVLGGVSQAIAQKPYSWFASRRSEVVTLGGFVPDEATAMANVAAAAAALPGSRVEDRQTLAFGAPSGFGEMATAIIRELPGLSSGKVALDDQRFCVEGTATTPEAFLALGAVASRLPKGAFQPVDCALEPPIVTPYRWSAEHRADGVVTIEGYYPSGEMRARIAALLKQAFPEPARIEDGAKPARGAPDAFIARVTRAVGELGRLRSGKVELAGDAYVITGQGPETYDACQALRLQIAQLDGPDSVARATIDCPPEPPPLPPMPALPEIPPLSIPIEPPQPATASSAPTAVPETPAAPDVTTAVAIPPPELPPAPPPPAPPVPLRWQVARTAQGLAFTGLVRDEAARDELRRAAAALADAGPLADRLTLESNLASEPDFGAMTRLALALIAQMKDGAVSVAGSRLALTGTVAGETGWRAIEAALARQPLPGGLEARPDLTGLSVRPYPFAIAVDKSGVSFAGLLPDEATHSLLTTLVAASPFGGKIDDATTVMPGAPPGFVEAAKLALTNLLRLDLGSASVSEAGVVIRGLTCRELIKSEVETSARSDSAGALKVEAAIALRQTGCVIDPPNTCQNDLDQLTRRNTVLFGQGTYVVTLDAVTDRVIGEAFEILKQCPGTRITVEGHANRDGEARGFDNLDLSQRRAARVRDELVRRGADPAALSVAGFGTTRPLVPHGTSEAKTMNRRVQFTVAK